MGVYLFKFEQLCDERMEFPGTFMGQIQVITGFVREILADALTTVTVPQIQEAANKLKLDTVYFLKGKEAQASSSGAMISVTGVRMSCAVSMKKRILSSSYFFWSWLLL